MLMPACEFAQVAVRFGVVMSAHAWVRVSVCFARIRVFISVCVCVQFGMFETVITGLVDAFPTKLRRLRGRLTFALCIACYLVSLPIATNVSAPSLRVSVSLRELKTMRTVVQDTQFEYLSLCVCVDRAASTSSSCWTGTSPRFASC